MTVCEMFCVLKLPPLLWAGTREGGCTTLRDLEDNRPKGGRGRVQEEGREGEVNGLSC